MKTNNQSGRVILLTVITMLILSFMMSGLFALRHQLRLNKSQEFSRKRAYFNALSSISIISNELQKPLEKRWGEGWNISGDRCLFTDSDGTKFECVITRHDTGQTITAHGKYGDSRFNISHSLQTGKK